jgi:RimJ/RimL family protein N-acetyltransferase
VARPTELRTPRLAIAPLGTADAEAFVAYRRDPAVARWQSWDADAYDHADAADLIAGQPAGPLPAPGAWLQLAIHEGDAGGPLLGDVAVHTLADQPRSYELGVTLAPAAQGRGVATEALGRVVEWLVADHDAHRVLATCDARNAPVARLLARLGFRHEGRAVEADHHKGEWTTVDTWARLGREVAAVHHQ